MAFTTQEESRLRTILAAVEDGQMIGDLPTIIPGAGDITVEGTGPDGQSGKFGLFAIIKSHDTKIAARRWDEAKATPLGEAWGNLDLLRELPGELGLGCYLTTDDRKSRKLDTTNHYKFADGTPAKLDGTMGQYMWNWRDMYYAWWVGGNHFYEGVSFSPIEKKNGECYRIPAGGTSALGCGVMDRETMTLCSLISDDPRYRGGNNNSDWDGTYRTLIGRAATNISATNFSVYARKHGEGWESQWYVARAVQEYLFRLIMGTRNSQSAFNPNLDANGLRQGGLGLGVTDVSAAAWTERNNQYPLLPTSAGIELGDGVGVVEYPILKEDGSVFHIAKVPVFFGLKNLWGHLWHYVSGLIVEVGREVSSVYVAPSLYADYNRNSVAGMIKAAETLRSGGYIKKISMDNLCCMPTEGDGTAATYYCDNFGPTSSSNTGLYCRRIGGGSARGTSTGAFFSYANTATTYAGPSITGALCFFEEDPIIS